MLNGAATVEKFSRFLRKLNTELSYGPAIPLLLIYPKEMNTDPHKNLYTNVHSSIIRTSPEVETIQMSINR